MRRLFAVALLLTASCGKSPSSPTTPTSPPPAFADFSGYWSGTFRDETFSFRLRQMAGRVIP